MYMYNINIVCIFDIFDMFDHSTYITFILLILLSSFELLAQFFLKLSFLGKNTHHIDSFLEYIHSYHLSKKQLTFVLTSIGMIIYAFTGFLFRESLKYKSFGVVGLLWHIVMTLLTILISIVIFNDKYNTRDIIGILLGISSMVLLLSNGHHH